MVRLERKKEVTVTEKGERKVSKPAVLNAFDIISLSEGLNLSGLFEKKLGARREKRFTSKCSAAEIMSKMEENAKPLGFNVKKCDYKFDHTQRSDYRPAFEENPSFAPEHDTSTL
ncbi:CBL-interacting protein kinase 32 [Nymphaea thermarum]|nr:CBL-interacting protein kinase 32 [Nymphaea thermarum]